MEFEIDNGNATYQIKSYGDDFVNVNGQEYRGSLIVMPELLITPWGPTTLEMLNPEHFQVLLPHKPQVVLLGTGKTLRFPAARLYQTLTEHRIGVEVMNTSAACRTYQILMSEGRKVAAAFVF